jgi:hypothetical protein
MDSRLDAEHPLNGLDTQHQGKHRQRGVLQDPHDLRTEIAGDEDEVGRQGEELLGIGVDGVGHLGGCRATSFPLSHGWVIIIACFPLVEVMGDPP